MLACDRWVSGTDRQTSAPFASPREGGAGGSALQDEAHCRQGAPGTAQPGLSLWGRGPSGDSEDIPSVLPSMCRGRWHRVSAAVRPPLISVQAGARFPITCCPPGPGPRGGRGGGGQCVGLGLAALTSPGPEAATGVCALLPAPHQPLHPNNNRCTPLPARSLQSLPLPISAVITSDSCRGNARGLFPLQAGAVTLISIFPLGNRADVPVQTCVLFCVRAHRCAFPSWLCTPARLLQPLAEMLLSVRSLMRQHGGVN